MYNLSSWSKSIKQSKLYGFTAYSHITLFRRAIIAPFFNAYTNDRPQYKRDLRK